MSNLMNKTKAQLIDIIERKDAVETTLRKELKNCNSTIESLSDAANNAEIRANEAERALEAAKKDCIGTQHALVDAKAKLNKQDCTIDDYKSEIDDLVTREAIAKSDVKLYRNIALISIGVTIIEFFILLIYAYS